MECSRSANPAPIRAAAAANSHAARLVGLALAPPHSRGFGGHNTRLHTLYFRALARHWGPVLINLQTRYALAIAERDYGTRIAPEVERTGDRRTEEESRPSRSRFAQTAFHVRSAHAVTARPDPGSACWTARPDPGSAGAHAGLQDLTPGADTFSRPDPGSGHLFSSLVG